MKTITVAASLTLALLLFGTTIHAQTQERLRPGKYDISVEGTAIGSHCYLPEDVRRINGDAQALRKWLEQQEKEHGGESCSTKELKVAGGTITMTVVCSDHTTSGVLTYHGDSFETVETVTKGSEVTTVRMKARRTGDCK